jgi:hypothetical protein
MVADRQGSLNGRARPRRPRPPREPPRTDDYHLGDDDEAASLRPDERAPGQPASTAKKKAGQEWASHAEALADWTMKRMVNRADAWGQFLPVDRRETGKAQTRKGELTREVLVRHYQGARVSDLVGLHTTSKDNSSRWLGIDVDLHGEPNEEKQGHNRKAAKKLCRRAKELGLRPPADRQQRQGRLPPHPGLPRTRAHSHRLRLRAVAGARLAATRALGGSGDVPATASPEAGPVRQLLAPPQPPSYPRPPRESVDEDEMGLWRGGHQDHPRHQGNVGQDDTGRGTP